MYNPELAGCRGRTFPGPHLGRIVTYVGGTGRMGEEFDWQIVIAMQVWLAFALRSLIETTALSISFSVDCERS
jgi:hypothetical protein